MHKASVATLITVLALIGCAAQRRQPSWSEMEEANKPLVCEGEKQCNGWWKLAQIWVAQNSRWKIQTATDAIIETYNPAEASPNRGYRITRQPVGSDGREQIKIASGCRNVFGCSEDELVVAASFKQFVRTGASQ